MGPLPRCCALLHVLSSSVLAWVSQLHMEEEGFMPAPASLQNAGFSGSLPGCGFMAMHLVWSLCSVSLSTCVQRMYVFRYLSPFLLGPEALPLPCSPRAPAPASFHFSVSLRCVQFCLHSAACFLVLTPGGSGPTFVQLLSFSPPATCSRPP